jgi:DNA-binding FrmR family transcriptional regulator
MNPDQRQLVLKRLKTIEGHLRGIENMVESDTYCIDVLKQTHAVQKALDKVNSLIMANHLNECVTSAMRGSNPQERERVIGEIVDVFDMSHKL